MRAVFTKELKDFLRGRKGWCILALLMLANGAFLTYFHFYLGNTRYEILLEAMMTVVGFLLPLWVVPRMNEERGGEQACFLASLPLTKKEIFFGKLWASVAILFGMTVLLGLSPLVLCFFGATHLLYTYLALTVAFLLGCAILFAVAFLSVLFRKQLYAWIASYGFLAALMLLSFLAGRTSGVWKTVFEFLSLTDLFSPLGYGLFRWEIPLWYLAVSLAFLCAILLFLGKRGEMRFGGKGMLSGVLACVLIAASTVSTFLPASARALDLSAEKTMSVSVTTEKYLEGIKNDVTLYLLTDDMSEDPYEDPAFEAFLDRYASCGDHIALKRIPVSESGSLLAEFGATPSEKYGYCIIAKSDKRAQVVQYSDMLYYKMNSGIPLPTEVALQLGTSQIPTQFHASYYRTYLALLEQLAELDTSFITYYYTFLNQAKLHFVGETLLNQLVEYVSFEIIPTSYVLVGHGESDMKGLLLGNLITGYKALELSSVQQVPADAASVLLLSPNVDYTAEEVRMLREYLNRGGSLTVITGEANLSMPNLMSLLSAYGLSAEKGSIRAEIEEKDKDGNVKQVVTDSVPVYVNENHDALTELDSMGLTKGAIGITGGNAISFRKTDDPTLITTALLTTVDTAFASDQSAKSSYILGAAAETADGAHLVWFTGAKSYLLTKADITENSKESIVYPLLCPYVTSMWTDLRNTSSVAEIPATLYEEPYLQATDTNMIVFGISSVLLIPACLVAAGVIRCYKRKKA
ncbi:MAG: Gldg family protein [Clostridia bacterium]|nr:Gldg family protein [Clostridia bacterium]